MIVYSGEQIFAHLHSGASEYLLVTFCELYNEHLADRHYFLKELVEAGDISCIGVMTTIKGFYLSPEMDEVIKIVERERRGRKVIVFGQSMGGYAAIKYSAALKADYVLACAPFFSVDPDDLELPSDRHRKIMMHSLASYGVTPRPEFKGMGIKPADCSGRLVVLYDPSDMIDVFDADLLSRKVTQTELIPVPHASHAIYNSSWSVALFSQLMSALQSQDTRAVHREMTRLRRNNAQFIARSLRKSAHRKPGLTLSALRSKRVTQNPDARAILADHLNTLLIFSLFRVGRREDAIRHFNFVAKEVLQLNSGAVEIGHGPLIETMLNRKRCMLLSLHGTFLAYDMATRSPRLDWQVLKRNDLFPIFARASEGQPSFYILSGNREIPVSLTADPASEDVAVVEAGADTLAIRSGNGYLGVKNTGQLIQSAVLGEGELFVPVPMPEESSVLKAGSLSWFDQVVLTQPPVPALQDNATPARARRGPRWKTLFARG